jgi:hypothetical protein
MSDVTPIRPGLPTSVSVSSEGELAKLLGYGGSIQGSPLESALDELDRGLAIARKLEAAKGVDNG